MKVPGAEYLWHHGCISRKPTRGSEHPDFRDIPTYRFFRLIQASTSTTLLDYFVQLPCLSRLLCKGYFLMIETFRSIKRTLCCGMTAPTMYSLDLKMEDPPGDAIPDQTFALLRDFLQPDSTLTLEFTARSIENLLPGKAPLSTEVWDFGESCIEVAEQIPYHHPSQLKLAELLEYLANSPKLGQAHTSKVSYIRHFDFWMSTSGCRLPPTT